MTDPPNSTPNPTQPKPYNISVHHGALTEAVVGAHNVVVFTGLRLEELLHWNEFCHARSIAFISADVKVGGNGCMYMRRGMLYCNDWGQSKPRLNLTEPN